MYNKIFLYNLEAKYFVTLSFAKLLFSSTLYNDETLPVFMELEILPVVNNFRIYFIKYFEINSSFYYIKIIDYHYLKEHSLVLNDKFVSTINLAKFLS